MGRRGRRVERGGLRPLRGPLPLAAPALPGARVDLPGGLCAGGLSDADRRGPGRALDGPPDGPLLRRPAADDGRGGGARVGGRRVPRRRAGAVAPLPRLRGGVPRDPEARLGAPAVSGLDPLSAGLLGLMVFDR
jgi:hypothetical protein